MTPPPDHTAPADPDRAETEVAASPPFLGTPEQRQLLKALTQELVDKNIVRPDSRFGEVKRVNIDYVVPEFHFSRRQDILSLLSENSLRYYLAGSRTNYFRAAGSLIAGFRRIHKYRTLFRSIQRRGLLWNEDDANSLPWLFASKECIFRLDGHHRASIARLLGHQSVPVLMMTPKDFRDAVAIDPALREAVAKLHEHDIDLGRGVETTSPSQTGAS